MKPSVILLAIFIPICVTAVFSFMQKSGSKSTQKMSDEYFVIKLPNAILTLGIVVIVLITIVILGFTFFSQELPHIIFYIVFGVFLWLSMYLILKTLRFKVVVQNEKITVYSIFAKPYSFTFSEIVSVVRQVKNNQIQSESMVIKTSSGKKLTVESAEMEYKRFLKKIQSEVKREYLFGFK